MQNYLRVYASCLLKLLGTTATWHLQTLEEVKMAPVILHHSKEGGIKPKAWVFLSDTFTILQCLYVLIALTWFSSFSWVGFGNLDFLYKYCMFISNRFSNLLMFIYNMSSIFKFNLYLYLFYLSDSQCIFFPCWNFQEIDQYYFFKESSLSLT